MTNEREPLDGEDDIVKCMYISVLEHELFLFFSIGTTV